MGSRRGVSPPLQLSSSVESSYSDFSDEYPAHIKKKSRSEPARPHRSHRYNSYKKQRHEGSSYDENRSRHHYHHQRRRNESRRKTIALRISSSSSSNNSETRSTSADADSGSQKEETKTDMAPSSDWVCGVCSNLNSTQRVQCYRCGATYAQSRHAKPSAEVCIRGVPESCTSQDLEDALKAIFVRHGESLGESVCMEKDQSVWHVRFMSSFESTKALIFCHCCLPLGNTICSMEFSKEHKSIASIHNASPPQVSHSAEAQPVIEHLPRELHPSLWKPPSEFNSVEDRKQYLETLSVHWQYLSETQKLYYDEKVKEALLNPHTSAQNSEHKREKVLVTDSETVMNPIETLKRKLEEKKKELNKKMSRLEVPNSSCKGSETLAASTTTNTISQLKQRLAEKKAQIAAEGKHSHGDSTGKNTQDKDIAETKTDCCVDDKFLGGGGSGSLTQTFQYVYGFPVPPLYDIKRSFKTDSIVFHCVPRAVACRILPLSNDSKDTK